MRVELGHMASGVAWMQPFFQICFDVVAPLSSHTEKTSSVWEASNDRDDRGSSVKTVQIAQVGSVSSSAECV